MRWCARLACGLAALVLAACGGGGGGGDSGGAGGFSVRFDRASVTMQFAEEHAPAPAVVSASSSGTPDSTVYLGATTADGQPSPHIDHVAVEILGTTGAIVRVHPRANLAPGTYSGVLLLQACPDATCNRHYAGSPHRLSYTITVQPTLKFAPAVLYLDAESGVEQSAHVGVTLPAGAANLTAVARDPSVVIDQISNAGFRVTLPGRPVGSYETLIDVSAAGIQRSFRIQQTVGPRRLRLSQDSVSLTASSGTAPLQAVNVLRLPEGANTYTATPSDHTPWLQVTNAGTSGFTVSALPLPSGTYRGTVTVRSGEETRVLDVDYVVTPPPGGDRFLTTQKSSLTFASAEGVTAPAQALGLTRPSWNSQVQWSIHYQSGNGWLSGSAGQDNDLQFVASAAMLSRGVYRATVRLQGAYPSTEVEIPVTLTVGPGLATPAARVIRVTAETTSASLHGTIPLVSNGVPDATWSAASSASWLQLSRQTGNLTDSLAYSISPAALLSLPAYEDHVATVQITARAAGAPVNAPAITVQTTVTLRRELPEVEQVGPSVVVQGKPVTVILRGRGIEHLTNPEARVLVPGVTPLAVTRLSDTALSVSLPALSASSYQVGISNGLGLTTPVAVLRTHAPAALPAGSAATGGAINTVISSPTSGHVYLANHTLQSVQRFRWSGAAWIKDTLAIAQLTDIGFSFDGGTLIAATRTGALHLIDPDTLTITATYQAPGNFVQSMRLGHGLPVTNDGKVWFGVGDTWNKIYTFDLRTRAFEEVKPNLPLSLYSGPWFEVSRNGEQMIVVQSASITPAPPLLSYTASSSTWRTLGVSETFFYGSENGLDDTGSRWQAFSRVYDRNNAPVGQATLPNTTRFLVSSVLSPDGERLYAMSLPSNWPNLASSDKAQVHVFDTSIPAGTMASLPLLGTVDLDEFPTCQESGYDADCLRPAMNITMDGQTLLIAGKARLLVVPVPQASAPLAGRRAMQMQLWRR